MIYNNTSCVVWNADFKPRFTKPKDVRAALNAWIRNDHHKDGWVVELILRVHSLALMFPNVAIVSTCGKFVAVPVIQGATLAVDIRSVPQLDDFKKAPAWADIIKKHEDLKGDGVFDERIDDEADDREPTNNHLVESVS